MQNILFDLDGTLIDHFSAIHKSVVYAQKELKLPESDYSTVRATVGGSTAVTLRRLCGPENLQPAETLFRKHFTEIMYEDVEVLPGSKWILKELKSQGHQLAVFTNKYETHARSILEHLGLAEHLSHVIGTGHGHGYRKPDPRFTMLALETMDCASEETAMIGDSPYDFAAAEAGCLSCYLVATGSHTAEALRSQTLYENVYKDFYELGEKVFNLDPQECTSKV